MIDPCRTFSSTWMPARIDLTPPKNLGQNYSKPRPCPQPCPHCFCPFRPSLPLLRTPHHLFSPLFLLLLDSLPLSLQSFLLSQLLILLRISTHFFRPHPQQITSCIYPLKQGIYLVDSTLTRFPLSAHEFLVLLHGLTPTLIPNHLPSTFLSLPLP